MGRPPKPTALKKAEGNPGKRRLAPVDLRTDPSAPAMPSWLEPDAKAIWRTEMPKLLALGITRKIDSVNFGVLCDSIARFRQASMRLAKLRREYKQKGEDPNNALLISYPSGAVQQNPLVGIINSEKLNIKRFAVEFGYSPAARSRLMIESGDGAGETYEDKLSQARPDLADEDDELTIQ